MTDLMTRNEHSSAALLARRQARRLSDATLEITAPLRMTPDFLIVGAQRCGTTSMFKTLMQHPDVVRPFLRKGVHYFDKSYDRGERWYRGHFPLVATGWAKGRGRPVITGESSPYYMFHPLARQRLAADLPGVKLVVLLRDPVVRAYSGHSHEKARGFEDLDFEQALAAEPGRIAGERERLMAEPGYDSFHWQHHAYVTRGQYIEQLRALEHLVGRERLCVVDSGDFFVDPEPVFDEVRRFLGLAPCRDIVFEQHNARQRSPLSDELRLRLEEHYAPYDEELARWWGRTPSWRRVRD
ncbi:sulfotransferase domain-containing protein [Nocardioides sp. MAHUQ-72]|uniref:sulfotransferase domain-containing protein n=1 Tax=unclassified Nocardioides TaxID=2615069 RepID=UPI00361F05EC